MQLVEGTDLSEKNAHTLSMIVKPINCAWGSAQLATGQNESSNCPSAINIDAFEPGAPYSLRGGVTCSIVVIGHVSGGQEAYNTSNMRSTTQFPA